MSEESKNCQACGVEYVDGDLTTIKLAGFKNAMVVCKSCLGKTAESSFKDAVQIINDIVKIAKTDSKDPEMRLKLIRSLIQG